MSMSNSAFKYISNLQYKVKALSSQVKAYESDTRHVKITEEYRQNLAAKEREIKSLKLEITNAHLETVTVRNNWLQVMEDLQIEHAKEIRKKDNIIKIFEERALMAERQVDELKDKNLELNRECYTVKTELDEEREKNRKLTAQINRDYLNSAIPSSLKPNHKKITNNREKTDRKPGGQPGHKGHSRKKQTPTRV